MDVSKCGPMFAQLAPERQNLETVKTLHQTIVSLRAALDKCRSELQALREKVISQVDSNVYADVIEKLSLENHILRQRILSNKKVPECVEQLQMLLLESEGSTKHKVHMDSPKISEVKNDEVVSCESQRESENLLQPGENTNEEKESPAVKLQNKEPTMRLSSEEGDQSQSSEGNQHAVETPQGSKTGGDSENESEELDDIELIFTTEETKELGVLQEDLVSITDTEAWQPSNTCVMKHSESHNFDDISGDSNHQDKEGICDDSNSQGLDTNFTRTWLHSVFVETDISKCGVVDENEIPSRVSRRNTLPNPLVYQPIIHREALSSTKSQLLGPVPANPRPLVVKFAPVVNHMGQVNENRKGEFKKSHVRPILVEKNTVKRESEAQTDITALPSHWKSESYLAHKVSTNFTTLPSKFALPVQMTQNKYSLKLSDKTQEARRTLLSDINFTSMVPELSRSADHLSQEKAEPFELGGVSSITPKVCKNFPRAYSYMKGTDKRENISGPGYTFSREYITEPWVQCNCTYCGCMGSKSNMEFYSGSARYQGSLTSIPYNSGYEFSDTKRRHSCKAASEVYRNNSMAQRLTWGSVPTSPTHIHRPRTIHFTSSYATPQSDVNLYSPNYWSSVHDSSYPKGTRTTSTKSKSKNKVKFQAPSLQRTHPLSGQSLPDLRVDPDFDSGDSTDSLIDEAEEYLRRSIDSILTGTDWRRIGKNIQKRQHLALGLAQEFTPPQSAQPFLPKIPRDLKLDYFVKIITAEGRVMVGKVRYVGTVTGKSEVHVGVELPKNTGDSDGAFQGFRYFDCDPDRAVFVPFKKVVMAWSI